ncbi:MAG: SpiroCoCo family coiled-coil protein [Treponema sp.]
MDSILIGLVILAINLIVIFVMRYFDRNNLSSKRVNSPEDSFDETVRQAYYNLQNVMNELNSSEGRAMAVVRKITDFEKKGDELDKKTYTIQELEARLERSSADMQKLMNITKLAEENINQIRREADFVDGIAKKINAGRSELETLNAAIPEMQKHFTNIAQEQLENYKTKILQDVETHIKSIETRVTFAEENANNLLDETSKKLNELYDRAFENAKNKSNTLEGETFLNLQKLAEKRMLDSRHSFDENLLKLETGMKEELSAMTHQAEEFRKEYITKINDYGTKLTNELSNTELGLNENVENIKKTYESFNTEIQQDISRTVQGIKDEVSNFSNDILKNIEDVKIESSNEVTQTKSLLENFKNEWKIELASYKSGLSSDFSNLELLLKNRVEEIKNEEKKSNFELKEYVDSNGKALKDEVEKVSETVRQDIAKDKAYLQEFKQNWQNEVSSFVQKIKTDFAETEENINSKSSLLITKMNEAERALQQTADYLKNEFENGEKTSTAQMEKMLVELQKNIDELSKQADKKIADFKVQFEARFKKFESLISGTDIMQTELEKVIAGAKDKVKEEFNHHVSILKLDQQTFARNFDSETEKLRTKLTAIDSNVEVLRTKAFDTVSTKLGEFEKEFFSNLTTRTEEMNRSFNTLKESVKDKLQTLLEEREAEGKLIEEQYKKDLEEKVNNLSQEARTKFQKLEGQIVEVEGNLTKRLTSSDDSIMKYSQTLKDDINVALEKARQYLEKELTDYKGDLQGSLNSHYFDLEEAAKGLKEKIDETKFNANVEFEGIKKDFELWKSGLEQRFDTSKSFFDDKILSIENITNEAMNNLKSKYDGQYNELVIQSNDLFAGFKGKIESLNDDVLVVQSQFKKEANVLNDNLNEKVKDAFSSIEKKVLQANTETNDSMENVRSMIHSLRENINDIQEKTTNKIQSDAERLNGIIEEIDKKQNAFIVQTQVFEKADKLKVDLEKSIEELKLEVTHFDVYKTAMDEISNQYNRVCKMEVEIETKITSFMNERGRIERIEGEFARFNNFSDEIDRKVDALKATNDEIQSYEVQLRKMEETISKVNNRYERLEKKEAVLDQTAESIGTAFEDLKVLERNIKTLKSEIENMPEQVDDIKKSMDALSFNKGKVETVFAKLTSLDEMLEDIEKQMTKLQESRSWLAAVETRLTTLSTGTDEKLKMLATLYKDEPSQASKAGGTLSFEDRENVMKLHRDGWTISQIANALKISPGEVDLIIEIGNQVR